MLMMEHNLTEQRFQELRTALKSGLGGTPDMFLGFQEFGVIEDVRMTYSKDYIKEFADFYDNQILVKPEKQVILLETQDAALSQLKGLVSSDVLVIADVHYGNHFVVVTGYDEDYIYINDPGKDTGYEYEEEQYEEHAKISISQFLKEWGISKQEMTMQEMKGAIGFPGDYGMIWLEQIEGDSLPHKILTEKDVKEEEPSALKQEPKTSWPTFHGNPARTGFSDSTAPTNPTQLWSFSSGFPSRQAIVDDGVVFVSSSGVFSLGLETGKELWAYSDEEPKFYANGLAAGDGRIFVTVNDQEDSGDMAEGFVYALASNTGEFLWKYQAAAPIPYSLPLLAENKVFVGDDSGYLYALHAETGKLAWKTYLEDAEVIHSSPAFDGSLIFVGTEGTGRSNAKPSYMYAIDPGTGGIAWRFQVDYVPNKLNLVHAAPAVQDGVVYFGCENGYFYALSSKDGELIWKKKIASGSDKLVGVSGAAGLGYGKVFIGTWSGKFFALDQKDGSVLWEQSITGQGADCSALVADEKVYFAANEGNFYCFDQGTGSIVWEQEFGGSSPALASGVLLVPDALLAGAEGVIAIYDAGGSG